MKTPDEIKQGLECCNKLECDACPYHGENDCSYLPCEDGLIYIRQLEAERDALINGIRKDGGLCSICKNHDLRAWAEPCCRCNALVISDENHWEWVGVQKEE